MPFKLLGLRGTCYEKAMRIPRSSIALLFLAAAAPPSGLRETLPGCRACEARWRVFRPTLIRPSVPYGSMALCGPAHTATGRAALAHAEDRSPARPKTQTYFFSTR